MMHLLHTISSARTLLLFSVLALFILVFLTVPVFADVFSDSINWVLYKFASILFWTGDVIVRGAQYIFLQTIYLTVFEFGDIWNNSKDGFIPLKSIWQAVRDIINLLIVVLFVIVTIMTVFGEFVFRRKVLIGLILAAILVNFSAFFILFIIDISNILFVMFFNLLQVGELGSLSPFFQLSSGATSISSPGWTFFLSIVAFSTSFFIFAGILYLTIILIERFIIALILVLGSPVMVIGFFLNLFGASGSLTQIFVSTYSWGKGRLLYIFSTPIILLFGITVLYLLFNAFLGDAVEAINSYVGQDNVEAVLPHIFRVLIASAVLIYGLFKIGSIAQNANITGAGGFKLFGKDVKFGQFLSNRVRNLADPRRDFRGAVLNALQGGGRLGGGALNRFNALRGSDRRVDGDVNKWLRDRSAPGLVRGAARNLAGYGTPLSDPTNRIGRAGRQAAEFGRAVESGKVWKNTEIPIKTLNEFEALRRRFNGIQDDIRGDWSQRDQDRYRRLRDSLDEIMGDNEKRKRRTSNRFWVGDTKNQMNYFLSLGGSENDGGGNQDEENGSVDERIDTGGGGNGSGPASEGIISSDGGPGARGGRMRAEREAREAEGLRSAESNPYGTLGVSSDASDEEIQRRRDELLREYEANGDEEGVGRVDAAFRSIRQQRNENSEGA